MAQRYGSFYDDISQVTGSSGWYGIYNSTYGVYVPVYVDQSYDNGGWVCVLANRRYTAGMNNLKYTDAVNSCNYRTEPSSDDSTNTPAVLSNLKNLGLDDVNIWIGLKFWSMFGGRKTSNKIEVVTFASSTNGTALNATASHSERHTFNFTDFDSANDYRFSGAANGSTAVGASASGFYGHATNSNAKLTTYDDDNDTHASNCSTFYNNNPWWYTSCWSGNIFAGGGYVDGPYWTSSNSSNSRQYMAVYIK
jgi:hypothetical protein